MKEIHTEIGHIYRHFKGNNYIVIDKATHTETGETLVTYVQVNGPDDEILEDLGHYNQRKLWARPESMFFDTVEFDGKLVSRFEEVKY